MAPMWTYALFSDAFVRERQQIAVDNAAIVLGQSDRKCLNELYAANHYLAELDRKHHEFHFCAQKDPTATCAAIDKGYEEQISSYHRRAHSTAVAHWEEARVVAHREAARLETRISMSRPNDIPLVAGKCSLCLLETQWQIDFSKVPIETTLAPSEFPFYSINAIVELRATFIEKERWDYVLKIPQSSSEKPL